MSTIEIPLSSKCGGKEMAAKSSPWRSRSWWARWHLHEARRLTAAGGLALAVVAGAVVFFAVPASKVYGQSQTPAQLPAQPTFSPTEPVNAPMGVALDC